MQFYVILLGCYCLLIVAASVTGGLLPWLVKLTHRRMQFVMSFVGGLMLGVALLHLLPHAVAKGVSLDTAAWWTLGGLLAMFLLIRVFHVHAHEHGEAAEEEHQHDHDRHGHKHCDHDHGHDLSHAHSSEHGADKSFSWVGLAFGLALHTIIDGLALGAAVAAEAGEAGHGHGWALYGLGAFLAVALHKPLDALSITSLMAAGGWSRRAALFANIAFALMCPLGAVGFVFGLGTLTGNQGIVIGCALAFSAGVFLCISLADLLPEVTFHSHDQFWLTAALFLGVGLAIGIGFFEHKHVHGGHEHHQHEDAD